jgi:hypothetical protein
MHPHNGYYLGTSLWEGQTMLRFLKGFVRWLRQRPAPDTDLDEDSTFDADLDERERMHLR